MGNQPVVTMSKLGLWGRFANQIFQYAFLRIYAQKNNFHFQTSSWIGQYLFGRLDPPITMSLPRINDGLGKTAYDGSQSVIAGAANPLKNVDIIGYFQYQTRFYAPYKEFFRSLFKPAIQVENTVKKAVDGFRAKGCTVIGLHLRRGDYETFTRDSAKCFFIAPSGWYLEWLDKNWSRFSNPVLFIASDEPAKVLGDFSKYSPATCEGLGVTLPKAPFYPDFYMLTQCDVLCISNSSFSFAASMLNERCKEFYRPRLSLKKLILYDPWNSHTIFRDEGY